MRAGALCSLFDACERRVFSAVVHVVMKLTFFDVGTATPDGCDAGPVPASLVAVTVNVYGVPLVSPLTIARVASPCTLTGVPTEDCVCALVVTTV